MLGGQPKSGYASGQPAGVAAVAATGLHVRGNLLRWREVYRFLRS
jgi:hypothetical protein